MQVNSVEAIARYYRDFWAVQKKEMDRRIQIPGLMVVAMALLEGDRRRLLPVGHWRSVESALELAEDLSHLQQAETSDLVVRKVLREAARKAGKAPKQDTLSAWIKERVVKRPDISLSELRTAVEAEKSCGLILDMDDEEITFINGKHTKSIPTSGLRSRLSRAKKEIRRAQSR